MHVARIEGKGLEVRSQQSRVVAIQGVGRHPSLVPPPQGDPAPVDRIAGRRFAQCAYDLLEDAARC